MRISDWSSDVCSSDLAGIGGEQIDDLLRLRDLGFVRHERFVDDIDLCRMDREHAAKAGAPALRGALAQAVEILVVALDGIDCRDAGGRSAAQADRKSTRLNSSH